MKNVIVVILSILFLSTVGAAIFLFQPTRSKTERFKSEKKSLYQLLELYNRTLNNPYEPLDTSSNVYKALSLNDSTVFHLEALQEYIQQNIQKSNSLDYEAMYAQTQNNLENAELIIQEIKEESREEVERQKALIDSLNNIRNNLVQRTAEKEQALLRNVENMDSLKNVIDLYAESKKEILNFKSPTGVEVTYFGQTMNGKAHGNGIGVYANGNKYEGQWHNGKKNGEGVYQYPSGESYRGRFEGDKRNGFGLYRWPNGDVYIGYWKNDRRHGEGVIKNKSGKVLSSGLWVNDLLEKTKDVDIKEPEN